MRGYNKRFIPDDSGVFSMMRSAKKVGPRGSEGNYVPRIRMAMEVVGVADTAKIANDAAQGTLQRALDKLNVLEDKVKRADESLSKAEASKAKKIESVKKRLMTRKAKLEADREKLSRYVHAVSARRNRRGRRNRRLRRR